MRNYNWEIDQKRIEKHIPDSRELLRLDTDLKLIADKLDEYKKQLEEKQAIIDRLVKEGEK